MTRISPAALFLTAGSLLASLQSVVGQEAPPSPGIVISGIVLDSETRAPLENAQVELIPQSGASEQARSNSQGRFTFSVTRAGRYSLRPVKSGYAFSLSNSGALGQNGRFIRVAPSEPLQNLELPMAKTGVVFGRVVDMRGMPVPGVRVLLKQQTYLEEGQTGFIGGSSRGFLTNDRGEYRIYNVTPGDYHVLIEGLPLSFRPGPVSLPTYYPGTSDPLAAVPVAVRPGVELMLTDIVRRQETGTPVKLRLAEINPASMNRELYVSDAYADLPVRAGEDPAVVSLFVPPGHLEVALFWSTSRGRGYSPLTVEVGSSPLERELQAMPLHRVTFRVMEYGSDKKLQPATGVRCTVRPTSLDQGLESRCSASGEWTLQRAIGRYRVELEQGQHVVEFRGPDGAPLPAGLEIHQDGVFDIVLSDTGSVIRGVVKDTAGLTVADAVVALVPAPPLRQADHLYRTDISDVRGGFELTGIVPGSYHVFAWSRMNGASYKNEEFMKQYEDRGTPLRIGVEETREANIILANERPN